MAYDLLIKDAQILDGTGSPTLVLGNCSFAIGHCGL